MTVPSPQRNTVPAASLQDDDVVLRRREKGRPLTTDSIDLRDPYGIIAMAIRHDESLAGEDDEIFKVPLESGHMYNQKAFVSALQDLQQTTAVPRNKRPRSQEESHNRQVITPVILSGLVAAVQERTIEDNGPSAVDLVAYCRRMRRAALTRHQQRQQRRRIQRQFSPYVISGILISFALWSTMKIRSALIDYHFLGSEEAALCQANRACRMASTGVWTYVNPWNRLIIPDCNLDECKVVEGQREYPFYSMHTLLQSDIVSLSELEKPSKPRRIVWPQRGRSSHLTQNPPLRWLGETIVNRLIRETIQESNSPKTHLSMLDCGCGVGGLLYAMLHSSNPMGKSFHYHGIALSATEIYQARRFQAIHGLNTPEVKTQINTEISFEHQDFDTPLPADHYSVVVAVESLSFSPDLSRTLEILIKSIKRDGMLIIVDDVLNPWVSGDRAAEIMKSVGKLSLKTYSEWGRVIGSFADIELAQVVDLSLKYDMSEILVDRGVESIFMTTWGGFGYRVAERVVENWDVWFSNDLARGHPFLQIMKLARNLLEMNLSIFARKLGYRRAELAYYFMILKIK